jgi:hypothetical protein
LKAGVVKACHEKRMVTVDSVYISGINMPNSGAGFGPVTGSVTGLAAGLAMFVAATATVTATGAMGQEGAGGVNLSFGVSQGIEISDNPGLVPVSPGTVTVAETRLSFGLSSETPTTRLALDGSTGLRVIDGPGDAGRNTEASDPRVTLAYDLAGATSRFALTAGYSRTDIRFTRSLLDFIDEDGFLVLPTDFDDLSGTGIRESRDVSATLTLREDAPLGIVLNAGYNDLVFRDVTDPDLRDSATTRAGVTFRLDINPATTASIGLRYSHVDEDGAERSETRAIDTRVVFARPDGDINLGLSLSETDDEGARLSVRAGRDLALPMGTLSAGLGATRDADGNVDLVGDLSWRQDLPRGNLTVVLGRDIRDGDDAALVTSAAASLSQALTPLSTFGVDLAYAETETTATGAVTTNATLGVSYDYALTPDWSLDLGLQHALRTETGVDRASGNTLTVMLSRSFDFRP